MTTSQLLEIGIEVILFLAGAYLLFFKSFTEELGKQTAELALIKQKTYDEEEVKEGFAQNLETFKKKLEEDLGKTLEPLKNDLSILANKQGQIFTLEKDTIAEFNSKLASLVWEHLGYHVNEFNADNVDQVDVRLRQMNDNYFGVQVQFDKMNLIVDDEPLQEKAQQAVEDALALKHFFDRTLHKIKPLLANQKRPGFVSNEDKHAADHQAVLNNWNNEYQPYFEAVKKSMKAFQAHAKQYIKLNR